MQSLNIGYIQEINDGKAKSFGVSLLDGNDYSEFLKIEEALEYFKYHALAIFNYDNVNSLHVQYLHENDVMHYLIFTKNEDGEVIVHEETKFDFLRTHPHKYSKYRLRRMINEKNYSFSDVHRASINWHPFFSVWEIILSVFLLAGASLFIVYGLNFVHKDKSNYSYTEKVVLLSLFFVSIVSVIPIIVSQYMTRYKLFQTSGDFKEIDWRKWYRIRITQLLISILFFFLALSVLIFFIIGAIKVKDKAFLIILSTKLGFWIIYFISSLSMLIFSQQRKNHVLFTYFSKEERKLFRQWAWKKGDELSKQDDIFLFDDKFSKSLTRKAIDETMKIMLDTSRVYLKDSRKIELKIRQNIIEDYFQKIKRAERTPFQKIINKEIPANILYEDNKVIAFYDMKPVNPGHFLVVPKKFSNNLMDIKSEDFKYLMTKARELAINQVNEMDVSGFKISINNGKASGQKVFHTHIHVIPSKK